MTSPSWTMGWLARSSKSMMLSRLCPSSSPPRTKNRRVPDGGSSGASFRAGPPPPRAQPRIDHARNATHGYFRDLDDPLTFAVRKAKFTPSKFQFSVRSVYGKGPGRPRARRSKCRQKNEAECWISRNKYQDPGFRQDAEHAEFGWIQAGTCPSDGLGPSIRRIGAMIQRYVYLLRSSGGRVTSTGPSCKCSPGAFYSVTWRIQLAPLRAAPAF
jgi:hypothetical protein